MRLSIKGQPITLIHFEWLLYQFRLIAEVFRSITGFISSNFRLTVAIWPYEIFINHSRTLFWFFVHSNFYFQDFKSRAKLKRSFAVFRKKNYKKPSIFFCFSLSACFLSLFLCIRNITWIGVRVQFTLEKCRYW